MYKNKTNKNTADKCIKIYYVSWFTYLKPLHNLSGVRRRDWRQFSLVSFSLSSFWSSVSQWFVHDGKQDSFTLRLLERQLLEDGRIRKWENKLGTHSFRWAHAFHASSKCFTECSSWDTQTKYLHGWSFLFFLIFPCWKLWSLRLWTDNHTHDKSQNIQKYYIFNLPRVRQFCN